MDSSAGGVTRLDGKEGFGRVLGLVTVGVALVIVGGQEVIGSQGLEILEPSNAGVVSVLTVGIMPRGPVASGIGGVAFHVGAFLSSLAVLVLVHGGVGVGGVAGGS